MERWKSGNNTGEIDFLRSEIEHLKNSLDEYRQAIESLSDSEEIYRMAAELANDGVVITSGDIILYVNQKFIEMAGLNRPSDVSERSFYSFLFHDDRDSVRDIERKRQMGDNVAARYGCRLYKVDQTIVPIEISASLIIYKDVPASLVYLRDYMSSDVSELRNYDEKICYKKIADEIDGRKKSEKYLKENEEKYRALIETTGTGFVVVDEKGRVIDANSEYVRLTGFEKISDILNRSVLEWTAPSEVEKNKAAVNLCYKEGFIRNFEVNYVDLTGKSTPIEINATVVEIAGEKRILTLCRDITERKKSEEALKEKEQQLSTLINAAPDIICFKDGEGRWLQANKADIELFQLKGVDYHLKKDSELADFTNPIYRSAFLCCEETDEAAWREGKESRSEERIPVASGGEKVYDVIKVPVFDDAGKRKGLVVFGRDISDFKKAEEERLKLEEKLKRIEKMEAIGTLAGGVAHDLNNVLGALMGYSELVLLELPDESPLKEDIVNIIKASERAAAIVQDLLTLGRRGVYSKNSINMNSVVQSYLKSPEFKKLSTINPRIEFMPDLSSDLMNIMGSPVHLEKMIMNLMTNAAEAISDNGAVTISTENCFLEIPLEGHDDFVPGHYVVLSISDSGQGISKEDLGHIFEPFYTKKVMGRSGTGLGLAVVWGVIKDHGGHVQVESEPGHGSVFRVYFPVTAEETLQGKIRTQFSEFLGRGETILVVDDIKEQRDLVMKMLGRLNYKVVTVSSGEEAIEYFKTKKADLVLLDMIMEPGMDGLDTYRDILKISPGQRAILVSGYSETDRVRAAREIGAGAYVHKPYVIEEIGLAVRKELDR